MLYLFSAPLNTGIYTKMKIKSKIRKINYYYLCWSQMCTQSEISTLPVWLPFFPVQAWVICMTLAQGIYLCHSISISIKPCLCIYSLSHLFFFTFTDDNLCFIGKCAPWFCNDEHPICGKREMMEVSLCQFLPLYKGNSIPVSEKEYPWSQGIKESKV